jgi:hypothetical protein
MTTSIEDQYEEGSLDGNLTWSANPLSGSAAIGFDLSVEAEVTLEVIDLAGRRIETLASGPMSAGRHEVYWQADVPTGVYLVRCTTPGVTETLRIVKF